MKNKISALLLLAALCSCAGAESNYISYDGFACGTTYHIVVNTRDTVGLERDMDRLFERVENSMSIHRPQSLLSRINRNETDSVDSYIAHCIEMARGLSKISGGLYDITVKPLTHAWGFGSDAGQEIPDVDYIMQFVGYDKIYIEQGRIVKSNRRVEIDLNSIAKGYTCDLMGEMLQDRGIADYLVEVGGEVFCRGRNSKGAQWVVGLDRPQEDNFSPGIDLQATINISGLGLATSGNYRRHHVDASGRKVVHTINPLTGLPHASNLLSATVIAQSCALADGYATMLMAAGLEKSKEILLMQPDIMACLIYDGGNGSFSSFVTAGLEEHLTLLSD